MTKTHHRRRDIQTLRAVAVLVVVAHHVGGWPTGGFVGVDVFFVISGFVITEGLWREYESRGRISLRRFYVRRVKRILPAAALTVVITAIAAYLLLPRERAINAAIDGIWSLLAAANLRMAATETDYFAEGLVPSPFQHYWSLSIEEQFYLILPVVLLLILAVVARTSTLHRARALAASILGALFLASLVNAVIVTDVHDSAQAYFSFTVRAWELGAGVMLALAAPALARVGMRMRVAMLAAGGALIAVSVLAYTPATSFPGAAALMPVLGTVLVIAAGTNAPPRYLDATPFLALRPVSYVGDISYSLYLWHFPAVILGLAFLPAGPAYYATTVAATAALAVLSYHLMENPLRRKTWPLEPAIDGAPSRVVRVVGVALAAVLVVGFTAINGPAQPLLASNWQPSATTTPPAEGGEQASASCVGAEWLASGCEMEARDLQSQIDGLSEDTGGAYDCYKAAGEDPRSCHYGSGDDGAHRVAIIGDSHAAMFLPALRSLADSHAWSLTSYVGNSCQWVPQPIEDCGDQVALAQADFTDSTPYDVIFVAFGRQATASWTSQQVDAAAGLWREAQDAGTRVAVIQDAPETDDGAMACLQRLSGDRDECGREESEALDRIDGAEKVAMELDIELIKTQDLFCIDGFCPSVIGGIAVYRDAGSHITGTYAYSMTSQLGAKIGRTDLGLIG